MFLIFCRYNGAAECVYPDLHVAYAGGAGDRSGDHEVLRNFIPAPASERFLHLLLPGTDETEDGFHRLSGARAGHQRRPDLSAPGSIQWKCDLVRNAGN